MIIRTRLNFQVYLSCCIIQPNYIIQATLKQSSTKTGDQMSQRPPKLLDRVREILRLKHYAIRTEETYVQWIIRFIHFHHRRHPQEMDTPEIEAFLTHLAIDKNVTPSTQNQALSAILFLYQHVLHKELQAPINALRARKPSRLPTVLTKGEVWQVIEAMVGVHQLMATLLYGSGMRLMECVRLRVKDIDFAQHQIIVRDGKGAKDRVTILPDMLCRPLQDHLKQVKRLHNDDLAHGRGDVYLPFALERKYPNANREWSWQYVFPSQKLSVDPRTGLVRRHHVDETGLQKAIKQAAKSVGMHKRVSSHTFRHSFATHLLEDGYDIRTVQELLGHKSVETTMIYTHVLNRGGKAVRSPADRRIA